MVVVAEDGNNAEADKRQLFGGCWYVLFAD